MNAIKIENLTKYYGKNRGVENINLTVEEGEFFGFIGPNGAGKSTTIRVLLGLIYATNGTMKIFNQDLVNNKEAILAQVGYLPSEAIFYSGMKVKDILKLSADLRKMDCEQNAKELCQRLELDMNKKVEELSFGNRKKVGIICALQHNPKLLILDEPTSGLDPLMQKEFFKILQERNQAGTTIFLSSHVLSEIQRNCTRAAIIREGKIVACDYVEKLAQTNAKRVVVRGNVHLEGLDGIRDKKDEDGAMNFLYSGDMNQLLKQLSKGHVEDLSISEPDLEEIFLHYYEKEDKENDSY